MPNSTPWRIAAIEASSSCLPQPKSHPPPPIAQVPSPTIVISIPLLPRGLFFNAITSPSVNASSFKRSLSPIILFRRRVHATGERLGNRDRFRNSNLIALHHYGYMLFSLHWLHQSIRKMKERVHAKGLIDYD